MNDKVKPYNEVENKTSQLQRMFDNISESYDHLNNIMTFTLAHHWRMVSIKKLRPSNPKNILDIAAGTGDMSIACTRYLNPEKIMSVDISSQMMEVGRKKVNRRNLQHIIDFEVADCAELPYEDNSFDAVTIGFGIRNFERLEESLNQIHRVLRKNGKLLILEVNEPKHKLLVKFYKCYSGVFVFLSSRIFSQDKIAYQYLAKSMSEFPQGKDLIKIIEGQNFKLLKFKKFTFGVSSMYFLETI